MAECITVITLTTRSTASVSTSGLTDVPILDNGSMESKETKECMSFLIIPLEKVSGIMVPELAGLLFLRKNRTSIEKY